MKTGFGSQSSPVKTLAPRSVTGQMKYFERMSKLVRKKPKSTVKIQAPTKPVRKISRFDAASILDYHTFHGLLRAQLDKLRPAKRDSHDVGEDVVRNDQHNR